ncbi:hypothetical protein PUN28_006158 [Cardiocondyla obscurior]|uniref:Uncharacterized protein n=1 Tax=Cardiocondyla obscurior TaxID=286306 RepID=A0AAW2GDI5_9HYME
MQEIIGAVVKKMWASTVTRGTSTFKKMVEYICSEIRIEMNMIFMYTGCPIPHDPPGRHR